MKTKISFLVMLTVALGTNCVNASECIDDDCEIEPIVYEQNIDTAEILQPTRYEINWFGENQSEKQSCSYDYNCPFETAEECETWYKKPVYKTILEPRAPHINPVLVDDMLYAIYGNYEVSANDCAMEPLLTRYKMLINASQSCCTAGVIYKMQQKKMSDAAIYEFLKDDANYFATSRCMVIPDEGIKHSYSNGVTGQMVADVRNSCLCKNRKWFESLLQPFRDIYNRAPQFKDTPFEYKYTDGLQRDITVSVNEDVQNTLGLLSVCPD